MVRGGNLYYIYSDYLGTPRTLTDTSNNVVWQWDNVDPFGSNLPSIQTVEFNFRLPGQYFDSETGLHYNYFRTYNPQTGKYISSDPIGLEGGTNTYGYVDGNPLSGIDPLGLFNIPLINFDVGNDSLDQAIVDRIVGFGDAIGIGTSFLRSKISWGMGLGNIDPQDLCSPAYMGGYIGGTIYGLATPIGRLSYIKDVGKIPNVATTAREAYEMRTSIKAYYRGSWLNKVLIRRDEPFLSLMLRKTPEVIIKKSGTTNLYYNIGIFEASTISTLNNVTNIGTH